MARSRPKLSQSPWSGLDAVRKIMDRFGEFGESLNRMAGALHGLEDSMKHLLGVTSRVTAAMLMLHGSLANSGNSPKYSKSNKDDKDKPDWDQIYKNNKERDDKDYSDKKLRKAVDDAETKLKYDRLAKERQYIAKLKAINDQKIVLQKKASWFKDSAESNAIEFRKYGRKGFIKQRADALNAFANKKVNPNQLNEDDTVQQFKDTRTLQKTAETNPTGPTDTTIKKWVLDTEYAFKSLNTNPEKAVEQQKNLSEADKKANRIITQISLVGVNELGQAIKTFTQNIEPALGPNENLYNLGNTSKSEHDEWKKREDAKTGKVSVDAAAASLMAFSQREGVKDAVLNKDLTAPKLVGKNILEADLPAMLNSFNAPLGKALDLQNMPDENKKESQFDPMTLAAKSIQRLLRGFKADELETTAKKYGLDINALQKLGNQSLGGYKQEDLMKLFGLSYSGAGAHDATSDATAYGRLEVLISKFSQIMQQTIDNRSDKQYLDDINLGEEAERQLESTLTKDYANSQDAKDRQAIVDSSQDAIKKLELEASNTALNIAASRNGIEIPDGPRANVSPFSLKSSGDWETQPTLTVDGEEVMSATKNPKATPADYIKKLKELKDSNATGLSGDTSEFDKAIDAFYTASKADPLSPLSETQYAGFKNEELTATPAPHRPRVDISAFETTGTGSFKKRPELNVDRLPAMTGPYADDEAYTQDMITKLDELIASDATNMQGNTDQLKALQDILKAALDELKTFKATPILAPRVPITSVLPPPALPPLPPTPPALNPLDPKARRAFSSSLSGVADSILKSLRVFAKKLNDGKNINFKQVFGSGEGNLKEAFGSLAKSMFVTATAASGAVVGLAQLASADTFATFQNSLLMLGMTVGSAFVKPILKLSWYIQQLADCFANLSPESTKFLESLAGWSIAIVGASMALKGLAFILSPIASVVKALWALSIAVGSVIQKMAVNGIGNTIAGGAAATGGILVNTLKFVGVLGKLVGITLGLYEAFAILSDTLFRTNLSFTKGLVLNQKKKYEDEEKRIMDESGDKPKDKQEADRQFNEYDQNKKFTENMLTTSEEVSDLFNKKVKGGYGRGTTWDNDLNKTNHPLHNLMQQDYVARNLGSASKEDYIKKYNMHEQLYKKSKKEGNELGADFNLGQMAKIYSDVDANARRSGGRGDTKSEEGQRLYDMYHGGTMQKGRLNEDRTIKNDTRSQKEKSKDKFDSAGGYQGLLASFQSFRSQPSYMGVEEAHRRVQIAALGSDPLEQKINEIRSNELAKMVQALGEMAQNSGDKKDAAIYQFMTPFLRPGY
jgi:hypothetical protein